MNASLAFYTACILPSRIIQSLYLEMDINRISSMSAAGRYFPNLQHGSR